MGNPLSTIYEAVSIVLIVLRNLSIPKKRQHRTVLVQYVFFLIGSNPVSPHHGVLITHRLFHSHLLLLLNCTTVVK